MTARHAWVLALIPAAALCLPAPAQGQNRGAPPTTPKAAAPIDLTGYWVSIVTEDWRYRMVTPTKGDYQAVPMNADARKVADEPYHKPIDGMIAFWEEAKR